MSKSMFVSTKDMLKNKQPKFTYDETVAWIKSIQVKSNAVFDELGKCLQRKVKPLPYELLRSDTKYNDGSWSPLFRVLRPERIENVVNLIKSFNLNTGVGIERATHLRNLLLPIIERWMQLFDQFDAYFGSPQASILLKTQFKSLATYNKLFVLVGDRISTGEIFDKDSYRDVFNGFVKYYNEFVGQCISAAPLGGNDSNAPKKKPTPIKRGAPKLSDEQLKRRKNAARYIIREVRSRNKNEPDQITVKEIDAIAGMFYKNDDKGVVVVSSEEEVDFAPFLISRSRDRWARENAGMSFRQLCISSKWEKILS